MSSRELNKSSSRVLPLDLDKQPVNKEKIAKMRPKIKINRESNTFKLTLNIPGYKKDDINVFAGSEKIAVKAVDRTRHINLNICKVYKAEYTLPTGVVMDNLRKSYQDGILCIRGEIERVSNAKQ